MAANRANDANAPTETIMENLGAFTLKRCNKMVIFARNAVTSLSLHRVSRRGGGALSLCNGVLRGEASCRWEPANPTLFWVDYPPRPPSWMLIPFGAAATQWGPTHPGFPKRLPGWPGHGWGARAPFSRPQLAERACVDHFLYGGEQTFLWSAATRVGDEVRPVAPPVSAR